MAKTLYKYEASSNKFVWFTTWDRALRNYYSDDYNYVPDPVVDNPYNTYVEFRSRKPGMVNVDWGDGIKEQFPMTKVQGRNDYRIIFRSLAIQYRKNPNTTWWFRKEDGSQYIPVDNHLYADGRRDVQRSVVIDFTCDIYYAEIKTCKMTAFPIVDTPSLESLIVHDTVYANDGIPVDKLSRSKKLTYISFENVGTRMTVMPEAITSKTEVYYFEVDKINPSINTFTFLDDWMNGERKTNWNDDNMSGRGLEHLTSFIAANSNSLRMDKLPDYIYEMRSITWFGVNCSTHSQKRSDDFVNSFYDLVVGWDQITMASVAKDGERNQFYGLTVSMYNSTFPNENQRPSGKEQAPEGFVKGSSNGSPATPMEKIYVLKNNYAQRWTIKPV